MEDANNQKIFRNFEYKPNIDLIKNGEWYPDCELDNIVKKDQIIEWIRVEEKKPEKDQEVFFKHAITEYEYEGVYLGEFPMMFPDPLNYVPSEDLPTFSGKYKNGTHTLTSQGVEFWKPKEKE